MACPYYNMAYQGTDGSLAVENTISNTSTDLELYMMTDTSPSITQLNNGEYVAAVQNTEGNLCEWYSGSGGSYAGPVSGTYSCQGLGMDSDTSSPSITALPGDANDDYVVAFRANTNVLWTYSPDLGTVDTDQGMYSASSDPSISTLSNGTYDVAFGSNTDCVYIYTETGPTSTCTGGDLQGGTSPGFTTGNSGDSWFVGYQGKNSHDLWTYDSSSTSTDTGDAMDPGTSPDFTTMAGGSSNGAIEGNSSSNYELSTYDGGSTNGTGYYMNGGTSPSISAATGVDGVYWVTYTGQNSHVIDYEAIGDTRVYVASTPSEMVSATSPSISP